MPFHNSTQHRPNFLNIVHKAFCDLVSCLSFQPHLPDQATASQSTDPIVQSSQTICSSLKIISYLCPFAHTGPCTVTVISLVRSRWGTIAITLYVLPNKVSSAKSTLTSSHFLRVPTASWACCCHALATSPRGPHYGTRTFCNYASTRLP